MSEKGREREMETLEDGERERSNKGERLRILSPTETTRLNFIRQRDDGKGDRREGEEK